MVLAINPVLSASRFAARPVGAHNATDTAFARRIFSSELTKVVLPTPGPPAIGVFSHQRYRIRPVGLVNANRPRGTHAVTLQKRHDFANHLLVGPARDDSLRALWADALDLK